MVTSRPVLKKLIEGKASPQDLVRRFDKATPQVRIYGENGVLRREEIQKYAEQVFKTIERVLESARREEATQRNREIKSLHLQMETVRVRLEQSVGRLGGFVRRNSHEPYPSAETSGSEAVEN